MNPCPVSGDAVAALLDGSADGFCALDRAARFVYVNRRAEQVLGETREALLGCDALERFADHAADLRRACDDGVCVDFRLKSRGAEEWFDVRGCPSAGGAGVTLHFRPAAAAGAAGGTRGGGGGGGGGGGLNDASADVLAAIGEAAPDFVWVTDAAGELLYVNRRWTEYTGLSAAQTGQRGYVKTIHPADLPRFLNEVEYAQREGRPIEGEFRYRRHDGAYRWFWVRSTPVTDAQGNLRRRVGVAVDVTDRRSAEQALRESERRFRTMADSAPVLIWMSGPDKGGVYFNRKWLEFTGRTLEQELGAGWLQSIHPDDVAALDACAQAFAERRAFTTQFRLRRHDGQYRWLLDTGVPRFTEADAFAGFIGSCVDITDRIEAERALRDSEARYRGIFDQAAVGMVEVEPGGRITAANGKFCEHVGYTEAELLELSPLDITHPDDVAANRDRVDAVLRGTCDNYALEKRYRRKDGSYTWAHTTVAAIRDEQGRPVRLVAVVQDVTVQKRLEAERQHTEQRLQAIIDGVAAVVYVKDVHGRFTMMNRHFQQVIGVDAATFLGKTDHDIFDKETADRFAANDRLVLETGQAMQFEELAHHPDGPHTYVSVKFPLRDADGSIYAVCGVSTDIDDRKKAEEALRQSEGKYRTLTDAVGSLMWMSDANGQLCYFNRRWDEFLNGDASRILGLGWKDLVHPDDLAAVVAERNAALAEAREYTVEYRLRRHDGPYRWHLTRVVPHKDENGAILNWFGTATDIHDIKLAEEAVLAAKAEAEHANRAKDQFLAVLSHELRTPLTPVVMTVAAMEMDRTLSPQLREDLAMIRRNIELETKLIDDLLDVTRIANGKLRLQPRAADVHALLRNVLEILRSDVAEKQLRVSVDLAAPDPRVFADPARLQQVFWNLIKNAIKFTPPRGSVGVRSWNPSDRRVCVEVTDTGAGIDAAVLPRIFNAFDQGEQTVTRQFGGLGLGLAISKALTELHGGTIRADSEGKGRGARFTVELPTRTPVERIVDQIHPVGHAADGRPRPRVLLVEDHLDTQRTLRRLLEDRGYEVTTAGSVAAALASLAAAPADVLVSDIGLPDATGHELMREARARYGIPGIAVSGFGMDGDLKASRDAGFAAHLTKPVDVQQLDGMIRSLLPRAHPAQPPTETRGAVHAPLTGANDDASPL